VAPLAGTGLDAVDGGAGDCVTVTVRSATPSPLIVTVAVLVLVLEGLALLAVTVTVAFPLPLPGDTLNQLALSDADQFTFDVMLKVADEPEL